MTTLNDKPGEAPRGFRRRVGARADLLPGVQEGEAVLAPVGGPLLLRPPGLPRLPRQVRRHERVPSGRMRRPRQVWLPDG